MLYGFILLAFGLFGGDSLLTGDGMGFAMRLGCLLTIILAPIAIVWWAMNLYTYFIDPNGCLDQHWEFFGVQEPGDATQVCPNPLMLLTVWILETSLTILEFIPGLDFVAVLLRAFIDKLKIAYGMVKVAVATVAKEVVAARKGAAKLQSGLTQGLPSREDLEALQQEDPLPSAAECNKKPVSKVDLKELSGSGKEIRESIRGVPDNSSVTAVKQVIGGGEQVTDSPILPFLLLSTIAVIVVSSIVLSLRRSMQNATAAKAAKTTTTGADQRRGEEDDVPPEPRGPRVVATNA
jgi:hypothetical protein